MTRSLFVAAPEGLTGKSMIALGLLDLLARRQARIGVFRPVTDSADAVDPVVELLLAHPAVRQGYAETIGVTYERVHADRAAALEEVVDRYHALADRFDVVVIVGSDYTDVASGQEMAINAAVAANIGAPVVLVVRGADRTPAQVRTAVDVARADLAASYAHPVAVVANRVIPADLDAVRAALAGTGLPCAAIPEVPLLVAPTVAALAETCGGTVVRGSPARLHRESLDFLVAAMSLPNVLARLTDRATVIVPGDRPELLPALLLADRSGGFPRLASIVLTGGFEVPAPVWRLIDGEPHDLPIVSSPHDTFETAELLSRARGRLTADAPAKVETALRVFAESVDGQAILRAADVPHSDVVTPLMFAFRLTERARAQRRRIVLPEGEDERVLRAAAVVLRRGIADLTLLGDEAVIRARAASLAVDISAATVVEPATAPLAESFAAEYARLRADHGVDREEAARTVRDVAYFGTMMVHAGLVDGMVSGAAHPTAHTLRPAFQIIRTAPGTKLVSSVFFMCLPDRVLVYGDCAVVPDPDAEQLADIAASSAATARRFGVEPRVALLSYSTGGSGAGHDVEKVAQATALVRTRHPDLLVDGPIQYDAAVDPGVAAAKLPGSPVAGRATVLVFPDLNTGNNTYKAVQRSAGALAIGPVLQGLAKPVNDLSRGALVDDIVNTIAITAIQAQRDDGGPGR